MSRDRVPPPAHSSNKSQSELAAADRPAGAAGTTVATSATRPPSDDRYDARSDDRQADRGDDAGLSSREGGER